MWFVYLCCVLLATSSLAISSNNNNNYYRHRVYRVIPRSEQHLEILTRLTKYVDMWKEPRAVNHPVDIMVDPPQEKTVLRQLERRGLEHHVMIDDVGELIDTQRVAKRDTVVIPPDFNYGEYHQLDTINTWMDDIARQYSDQVSVFEVGRSFQGRSIKMMKISTGGSNKPIVWLDSGIHSREWAAPATLMWITKQLLSKYENDNEVKNLMDKLDWYILPVFNVDGYAYTWSTDRMWRKTLSTNDGSSCLGCDPNRNWDFHWAEAGVSLNPCSNTYPGSAPFSEVEVDQVVGYLRGLSDVRLYMAYHSYSQFYMLPWGYTSAAAPDYSELMRVCSESVAALKAVHNMDYECNSLINLVGSSSGSSVDYTYGFLNITYSVGVELRDQGQYGFLLPTDQIVPTAQENYAALLVWANQLATSTPTEESASTMDAL